MTASPMYFVERAMVLEDESGHVREILIEEERQVLGVKFFGNGVKPRMSLNITVMSVFFGSTSCGLTSSLRITSGLKYCPKAERTRRFPFLQRVTGTAKRVERWWTASRREQ